MKLSLLHYVKASDVEFDYCFLEISLDSCSPAFMDVRVTANKEVGFCFYAEGDEVTLSLDQWQEIQAKAVRFYKSEIENEDVSFGS